MCFLYRQSISIVYESKFKYIYRYFIKIDRCFCGILQSLPLRKCGLKYLTKVFHLHNYYVTSLAEVWIEMQLGVFIDENIAKSLPLRKCGLKYYNYANLSNLKSSLPLRKCGLKSHYAPPANNFFSVTSLAEVWIEIFCSCKRT